MSKADGPFHLRHSRGYLLWLAGKGRGRHQFPFLELIDNIRMNNRDVVRGPLAFIVDQANTEVRYRDRHSGRP